MNLKTKAPVRTFWGFLDASPPISYSIKGGGSKIPWQRGQCEVIAMLRVACTGAAFGRRRKRNSSRSVRRKAESGAIFSLGGGRDFFSMTAKFFLPGSTIYHADVSIFPLGLQCLGSAGETPPMEDWVGIQGPLNSVEIRMC